MYVRAQEIKNMSPRSQTTVVKYLDWMIDLPWFKKDNVDIDLNSGKILDEIFWTWKVKERIIEFLAFKNEWRKLKDLFYV